MVGVTRWQALYQFLGMSQVRQPLYRGVVLAGVVTAQVMVHHGLHTHRVPSVTSRMEGTVAWVWGEGGVDGGGRGSRAVVRSMLTNQAVTQ